MQIIDLDLSHEDFFCAVTGRQIRSDEFYEPSPAMVFAIIDVVGEIEPLTDAMQNLLDEVTAQCEEPCDIEEAFLQRVQDDPASSSYVGFRITTCGMACGPVSTTALLVIDMEYRD